MFCRRLSSVRREPEPWTSTTSWCKLMPAVHFIYLFCIKKNQTARWLTVVFCCCCFLQAATRIQLCRDPLFLKDRQTAELLLVMSGYTTRGKKLHSVECFLFSFLKYIFKCHVHNEYLIYYRLFRALILSLANVTQCLNPSSDVVTGAHQLRSWFIYTRM